MAYKIYDSCKSERELYIVSGSEHTDCYRSNPEKYESIVSECGLFYFVILIRIDVKFQG